MTFADIYLLCFVVGFLLSAIALLTGGSHGHFHHGHFHLHAGGAHGGFLNFSNIAAFLTWFGGTGFLLTRFSGAMLWIVLPVAALGGLLGASIVFWFSLKLLSKERPLDPADYEMVGVLGHLTSAIRDDGIGEMSYSQAGVRRSAPARSDDGHAIPIGAEVLVTRFEQGIAFVRPWEEMNRE